MTAQEWGRLVAAHVRPAADLALTAPRVWVALVVALALVATPAWSVVRLGITLVHELGHAFVGVAVGRSFTGFELRGDMSGAAVTRGRVRGPGRVATTWAGYPAPAVVGAALVGVAAHGWAAPVLSLLLLLVVLALVRVRSVLTLVVVLAVLAAGAGLWWWRDDALQAQVLTGLGLVLIVGAWRHLGAVRSSRDRSSDPGVLASLTHLPRVVWTGSFALVCAGSTWAAGAQVVALLR
ncbi:MAG: M50 family metallopeptidase [Actinomycetota bacterium]|nr:M50 family metallopeptidase [Actinomycetota bacterium]